MKQSIIYLKENRHAAWVQLIELSAHGETVLQTFQRVQDNSPFDSRPTLIACGMRIVIVHPSWGGEKVEHAVIESVNEGKSFRDITPYDAKRTSQIVLFADGRLSALEGWAFGDWRKPHEDGQQREKTLWIRRPHESSWTPMKLPAGFQGMDVNCGTGDDIFIAGGQTPAAGYADWRLLKLQHGNIADVPIGISREENERLRGNWPYARHLDRVFVRGDSLSVIEDTEHKRFHAMTLHREVWRCETIPARLSTSMMMLGEDLAVFTVEGDRFVIYQDGSWACAKLSDRLNRAGAAWKPGASFVFSNFDQVGERVVCRVRAMGGRGDAILFSDDGAKTFDCMATSDDDGAAIIGVKLRREGDAAGQQPVDAR